MSGVWVRLACGLVGDLGIVMDDIGVDCVRSSELFDFKNKFDDTEDSEGIYNNTEHSCLYYDMDEFRSKFCRDLTLGSSKFSTFSLNIRSLPGKWEEFRDFVSCLNGKNFRFSVIAVQEVWNVPRGLNYDLVGYKPFEYRIRDPSGLDGNAGGGVGIWVDNNLEFEILDSLTIFEPHFFESLFIY